MAQAAVPSYHTTYVNYSTDSEIYTDSDGHIPVNSSINSHRVNSADSVDTPHHLNSAVRSVIPAKPTVILQWLPWAVMLLISIGFVWWWQNIHDQILQVLNTIE
jgi:ATP-dependent Zn protease